MATCNESIAAMSSYDDLVEIIPNTVTPFSVTATENNLFRLPSPEVQTVKFTINVTSPTVALTITALRWDGTTAVPIGSVTMTNPNAVAYIDFQAGDYIICVRATGFSAQAGSFIAEFTGYAQEARFNFNVYSGEYLDTVVSGPPRPPRECNEALFFEIIDGELPPGLDMDFMGTITGWLPNLDCLEDRWSPAVNWYYEENDGTMWPWGREWRFQVKVWVDGFDDTSTDEEWFCVRIHNNWTYDQERFKAQLPFEHVTEIRVVDAPPTLPIECQPCKNFENDPVFVPQRVDERCLPCEENTEAAIELIPIPLDLCHISADDFFTWFIKNDGVDSGNEYIEKFKEDLRESPAFNILRARAGFIEPDPLTDREKHQQFVIMQNYQNYLQLATVILNEGEGDEYKSIVREWQVIENQVLPMQGIGYMGDSMEVELK